MNLQPIPERLALLDTIRLDRGRHGSFDDGHCALEVVAWLAGDMHTDAPECVSLVLAAFVRRWNDDLDDAGRQMLKPILPRLIGTAGDGKDELRGWMAADWFVRVHTPAWLELAGITESAAALRALPPIRDLATLDSARPCLEEARARSAAAWAAAWDAAWDAAWAAAWAAAGAAAGAAAWAAAREKLAPTKGSLQASALRLLDEMIEPR
jgi:hypothetical protein